MFTIYLRILGLLRRERFLAIALAAGNLGLAAFLYLEPLLFGRVIDAMVAKLPAQVWHYIRLWLAVGLVGVAANVWTSLQADRLAHRSRLAAITKYFSHAISLPLSFHRQHHTGRLMRILYMGSSNLFVTWLGFFREHLATLLSILVMLPFAWHVNWKLASLMTGLMFSFAIFNAIAMRRTQRAQRDVEHLHSEIAERTGDVLSNALVVQAFNRGSAEVASIRELSKRALAAQYPVLTGFAWLSVATRAASTLTVVAIFVLGAHLNSTGEVSVGQIVTFVGFSMMLIGRMEQLAGFISALFQQTPSLRDFFGILDLPRGEDEHAGRGRLQVPRGEVVFENVSFRYSKGGQHAIRNLSFRAAPGATIALVGSTGAGKSTALSLLYRAYDPSGGRILIDGTDIQDVTLASLRDQIGVVFQDAGLLYRSIADNIRIGSPEASDARVVAAARAAQAHDFIVVKPSGYETLVAERGTSLSGGERQRLAIARAMIKDAPILVLDEATSALDNTTEQHIQKALRTLTEGHTTFVIAHRLSTVRDADLIIVMRDGQIAEQGSFDELMAFDGAFAELHRQGRFTETEPLEPDAQPAERTA